jgi:hypothetical protein
MPNTGRCTIEEEPMTIVQEAGTAPGLQVQHNLEQVNYATYLLRESRYASLILMLLLLTAMYCDVVMFRSSQSKQLQDLSWYSINEVIN